ncbi:hypothetical protein PCH70_16890 [Pseudomonas cichorii JBC1]|nr:hypothetical protein PCH70_16890 [Pseudomonas cichorii JBC1]
MYGQDHSVQSPSESFALNDPLTRPFNIHAHSQRVESSASLWLSNNGKELRRRRFQNGRHGHRRPDAPSAGGNTMQ